MIVGYLFYPVAFLLGVERNGDLYKVAKLIGTKVVANEFVAVSHSETQITFFHIQELIYSNSVCSTHLRRILRLFVRSISTDCNIRPMWLWKHQLSRNPDWRPLTTSTRPSRQSCEGCIVRFNVRNYQHFN
jgi:hypothetical protein